MFKEHAQKDLDRDPLKEQERIEQGLLEMFGENKIYENDKEIEMQQIEENKKQCTH